MNNELQNLLDKPRNEPSLMSSLQKDEKSNSGQMPSLVKYKINPKSDEYSKWRVLKSQYMKLYSKDGGNPSGHGETKRRSQTAIGKQSIIGTPEKLFGNKERTPTLHEKNTLTPSHKLNMNNDSIQSLKENNMKNELIVPSLNKMSRANTTNAYDLVSAIDGLKNDNKPKSTIFNRNIQASTSERPNEKSEPSILETILKNRENEKLKEREQEKAKQATLNININNSPMKSSTFGTNITLANNQAITTEVLKIPLINSPEREKEKEKTQQQQDLSFFNFKKPNHNKSYIEEYLKRIHFNGKKEAFEISNDFMNEEDQEIDREIHQCQKKLTEVNDQIKSLGFRKVKRHLKDPLEVRYIDQIADILKEQEPLLVRLINRDQEKLEMKNEIRTLRSLIEACIKTQDEKTKEYEKEVKSLRDLIEGFNENRVYSLEMENKKLKDQIEHLQKENKDLQDLLDKKSKELSFLYADAENTKESIISELRNLKELKDKLLQEKQRLDIEKREISSGLELEKDKLQTFIINEPGQKQETRIIAGNTSTNKSKFGNKNVENTEFMNMSGRFSKYTAELIVDNKAGNEKNDKKGIHLNSQPVFLKDLKDPPSSKGLFYNQDMTSSEKLKPFNQEFSRSNSNVSSQNKYYYF